uniref:Uncharacterized protein n=2 Tax=Meloidogyne TaxID=189290 RepID=A0A6V7VKV8_MELEN|nr:unnamed protein product [Meloidogyne enterolobii]CAD2205390.1 unnamed protein product [Meloidogyne enterolobii]
MPRKTSSAKEVKEVANEKGNVESTDTVDSVTTKPANDLIEIHTPFYEPLTKEELAKAKDKKTPEDKKTNKNEYLWKLIRCKYLLTIKLCSACQNRLFLMQDKFIRYATGVTLKIDLCNDCIDTNCRASDVLAPFKQTGTKRKAN